MLDPSSSQSSGLGRLTRYHTSRVRCALARLSGSLLREILERVARTTANQNESVSFNRRNDLPGIEVRVLDHCDAPWCRIGNEFEFLAPVSWHAQIWHRRHVGGIAPGRVLCAHPGEALAVERVLVPGAATSLLIEPQLMERWLAEHDISPVRLRLRAITNVTQSLLGKLLRVCHLLRPGPPSCEVEASIVEFVAALVGELVEDLAIPSSRRCSDARVAERLREYLDETPTVAIDLTELATQFRISRFRMQRAFKRRFGVSPCLYQLQLRLGRAQKALREGKTLAEAAAQCGFFDQSHLTRHFKRQLGVTPAKYARGSGACALLESGYVP